MLPVKIAGLGWALPQQRVASTALEQRMNLPAGWIERATGVAERRFARSETTLSLAADASRRAIANAGIDAETIDLVVGASTGPHQAIPCTAALLQRELAMPEGRSFCFDLNATCLSFLVALHTAGQFITQGTCKRVLVFSSEVATHMRNFDEPESAVLLGDAAAAAVLERSEGHSQIHGARFETHASGADHTVCLGGGTLHHPNDAATTPAMNCFRMDGKAVFKMARRLSSPFVDAVLAQVGWRRDMVDAVVPHQASGPGVDLLERQCGFRSDQIVRNLATRGNCVAASIPLALAEAAEAGRVQRRQRVLLVGTGAGLSLGAVALTF